MTVAETNPTSDDRCQKVAAKRTWFDLSVIVISHGHESLMRACVGSLAKASFVFVIPVVALVVLLSVAGRERGGVIEASNLFSVPARGDTAVAYIADGDTVAKGEVVVKFASDTSAHRIASLKARRQELMSSREALKTSLLPQSAETIVRLQAQEQRLTQLDQRLTEVEAARPTQSETSIPGKDAAPGPPDADG